MLLIVSLVYLVSLLNDHSSFKTQLCCLFSVKLCAQTTAIPQHVPHRMAISCLSVGLLVEVNFLRADTESLYS